MTALTVYCIARSNPASNLEVVEPLEQHHKDYAPVRGLLRSCLKFC